MIIFATVGPNSTKEESITKMVLAGANVLRFSLGYEITEEKKQQILLAQQIITDLNAKVKIMIDFPSNKTRIGEFPGKTIPVQEGSELIFRTNHSSPDSTQFIPIETEKLGEEVQLDQTIIIGNGEIMVQVIEILDPETIRVRALNSGAIYETRSINIVIDEEKYTSAVQKSISAIKTISPNYIAVPYLTEEINTKMKQILKTELPESKITMKITSEEAVKKIHKICADAGYHSIIIDRGKLGVNMPYEKLGITQKILTREAKKAKKPIFVSTQILESTIENYIPAKSDILDVTNIVLDDVDGIVLCKETSFGLRPSYSIRVASTIIEEVKRHRTELIWSPCGDASKKLSSTLTRGGIIVAIPSSAPTDQRVFTTTAKQ